MEAAASGGRRGTTEQSAPACRRCRSAARRRDLRRSRDGRSRPERGRPAGSGPPSSQEDTAQAPSSRCSKGQQQHSPSKEEEEEKKDSAEGNSKTATRDDADADNRKKRARSTSPNVEDEDEDDDSEAALASYQHPNLRALRKALAGCLELHQHTMYQGRSAPDHYAQRLRDRTLKRQRQAERDLQQNYLATTRLRAGRVERLQQMQHEAEAEERDKHEAARSRSSVMMRALLVPDGHVDTTADDDLAMPQRSKTKKKAQRRSSCWKMETVQQQKRSERRIRCPQHTPNNSPSRAPATFARFATATSTPFTTSSAPLAPHSTGTSAGSRSDLTGRVAVLTGARVKIGRQVALKLLRAGATVVATTRFPNAAVQSYRAGSGF